jgi:hypothetical protein
MDERDSTTRATVWAAEHGASSPDLGGEHAEDGANAGVRFRIHGRLGSDEPPPDAADVTGDDVAGLRRYLAQHTEVNLTDVSFSLRDRELRVDGTVMDEGEREELMSLLCRLPAVKAVHDGLRVKNV